MEKLIEAALKKAIEMGWIIKNPHITDEALVAIFFDAIKDISVRDFLADNFADY